MQAVEQGVWFMVQVHSVGSGPRCFGFGPMCCLDITVRSGRIAASCLLVLKGQSADDECHRSADHDRLCSDLFIARNTHLASSGIIYSIIPLKRHI